MATTLFRGTLSTVERTQRLLDIKKLIDDGRSVSEISEETGIPRDVVSRNLKYLDELAISNIDAKELANKRQELYVELTEAGLEAQKLFDLYKNPTICPLCEGTGIDIKKTEKKDKDGNTTLTEDRKVCDNCKGLGAIHRPKDANNFLLSWMEIINKKAILYGLNTIKADGLIQFNQQINNYKVEDKIDYKVGEKLRKALINKHEDNLRKKLEDEI